LDVVVEFLLLQQKDKNDFSTEISLGNGKGEKEDVRHFLPLLLSASSQKCYLLPGAPGIFPGLPSLPFCRASLKQEKISYVAR